MFARGEAKTRIQQRDWLAKKFAASSTNHVAGFLFSLRVARANSPSGKRALLDLVLAQLVTSLRMISKSVIDLENGENIAHFQRIIANYL